MTTRQPLTRLPPTAPGGQMDRNPEDVIAEWRDENKDDSDNHNFEPSHAPSENAALVVCKVCGDDEAGLLHAFDPQFPPGYHDEAIYEVAVQDEES